MAVKALFKLYDLANTQWVSYWFASVTSQVASDSSTRRYVTDSQLAFINAFDSASPSDGAIWMFNQTSGKWEVSYDFLHKANPAFTGVMVGDEIDASAAGTKLRLYALGTGLSYIDVFKNGLISLNASGQIQLYAGTNVDVGNKKIIQVAAPTAGTDAANKEYVDNLSAVGTKPKEAVKVASTANISSLSGLVTIDGYTLQDGDRLLLKNQTTASQNGVYTASGGSWVKVTADSGQGALVFVENGTSSNDWQFYNTDGTTWIAYAKSDTYGVIASRGLYKSGTNFGISDLGITNAMLAGSIDKGKIANFSALDTDAWASIEAAATLKSLANHFTDIYSAIKLLRGTANYNTSNEQTLTGAYLKNKVYLKTTATDPTGTAEVPLLNNDICIDTYGL